jgi:hypothetical protein
MGGTCGTYGEGERYIQALMWKLEGERPLGRLGVDGRIILR